VYSATCVMCHNDATSHIMTHDATLIVRTLLSHSTHFTFTLSTLSLSLSLYIIFFSLCFSFSSREEVMEDVEEKKEKKEEEGEGVLKGPCDLILGLIFYLFFLSTIYGVLFFLL
jgi:hypothetical protein